VKLEEVNGYQPNQEKNSTTNVKMRLLLMNIYRSRMLWPQLVGGL